MTAQTRITCESEDSQEAHQGDDDKASSSREPESGRGRDDGAGHDDHGERSCSAADLTAGTKVHEAETQQVDGGLTFEKVELLK